MTPEQLPLPGFLETLATARKKLRAPRANPRVSLRQIIRRKFRRRWSDLELLVLLEIGVGSVSYTELVERTGGSTSGIWNALQNHLIPEDLVSDKKQAGRTFYSLTPTGQTELYKLLQ